MSGDKRIMILGSTGYVGRRLTERLVKAGGYDVVCVHRSTSNINVFQDISDKIELCVSDAHDLEHYISDKPLWSVINCSCSYVTGDNSSEILQSNLLFPAQVLAFSNAAANKLPDGNFRFISLGTGLPDDFNLYTITKKGLNDLGRYFALNSHLKFVNIELENYYGPDEPKTRFLPDCIKRLKSNQPLFLTAGEQHRDFVYIDDVIDAIMLLIDHTHLPQYLNVPIGSGEAPSIREFITELARLMDSSSPLHFGAVPSRPNEPSCYADLSTYRLLGGEIRYSWRDGLKHLLEMTK